MRGGGDRQLLVCRDFPFIINLTRHFCYYHRVKESWRGCRRRSPELMNFSNFPQDKWLQLRFTPASRCNVNPTIKQLSSNFYQFHYTSPLSLYFHFPWLFYFPILLPTFSTLLLILLYWLKRTALTFIKVWVESFTATLVWVKWVTLSESVSESFLKDVTRLVWGVKMLQCPTSFIPYILWSSP